MNGRLPAAVLLGAVGVLAVGLFVLARSAGTRLDGGSEVVVAPESEPPADVEEVTGPPARRSAVPKSSRTGPERKPRPIRPDFHRLEGQARIQAMRDYRRALEEWQQGHERRGPSPVRKAKHWAATLLGEDDVHELDLRDEEAARLLALADGLEAELTEVRRQIRELSEPIYERRLAEGDFEELPLEAGFPPPVPGIVQRTGVFPSRTDPKTSVRRVVRIRPGDSSEIDRLRGEQMRIAQLARYSLEEQYRGWQSRRRERD